MKITANPGKGSIVVTTLWIMAIMSLLAMGIAFRASLEVRLSKYNIERLQARYLAEAGITKSSDRLSNKINTNWDSMYECGISLSNDETPENVFAAEFNKSESGTFAVYYTRKKEYETGEDVYYGMMDEERKININMSKLAPNSPGEFRRILKGLSPEITDEIISAMIDWQDGGDFDSATMPGGAEDFFYETKHGYSSKDADFETTEELLLVKDVTKPLFNEIKEHITVYGNGKININTASKKVLIAVIDDGNRTYLPLVENVIDYRNGTDGIAGTNDDQIFTEIEQIESVVREDDIQGKSRLNQLMPYFIVKSDSFMVVSHGKVGKITKEITCIIRRDPGSGLTKIEYYHEE